MRIVIRIVYLYLRETSMVEIGPPNHHEPVLARFGPGLRAYHLVIIWKAIVTHSELFPELSIHSNSSISAALPILFTSTMDSLF